MSYSDLKEGTTPVSISFIKAGVPTQDPDTLEMIYTAGTTITTTGNFIHLSPTERVKRQQIQDDSKYKLVIEDTTANRTLTSLFTATVNDVVYQITGQPKFPQFTGSWITVYIKE